MNDDLQHGGALDKITARFPDAPRPWLDLSTGINPWPWPVGQLDPSAFHQLPGQAALDQCGKTMRAALGAPRGSLLLVPGTESVIRLLPQCLGARRVIVLSPSYGDHADAWRAAGAEVVETNDPLAHADTADAIVICNPNNPDGRRFERDSVLDAWRRLQPRGGWLIVDEAFAELAPELSVAAQAGAPGLIVLRSSGKFFGLAGLRLGAVLGPGALQEKLKGLLGIWRVSGPALHAGARAYGDARWQAQTRARLSEARKALDERLVEAGCSVTGGTDLFRLVAFADAHTTWTRLCERGVYTRRFAWTNAHLRIGLPHSDDACQRLVDALANQRKR